MKCPHCGQELETAICPECGGETPAEGTYCCHCGAYLEPAELAPDLANRVLCPDGTCIGVLNDQGVCSVCGLAYKEALKEAEDG